MLKNLSEIAVPQLWLPPHPLNSSKWAWTIPRLWRGRALAFIAYSYSFFQRPSNYCTVVALAVGADTSKLTSDEVIESYFRQGTRSNSRLVPGNDKSNSHPGSRGPQHTPFIALPWQACLSQRLVAIGYCVWPCSVYPHACRMTLQYFRPAST